MADLNALIAQGAQFNLPNPVDQYSKVMQLQQMGQANQLNKLKMDEYTRGVAEQNAMRGVMAQPGFDVNNPAHQAALLQAAPGTAPTLLEKLAQVKKEQAQTGLYGAQGKQINYEVEAKKLAQGLTEISNMPSAAAAKASVDTHIADGSITPEKGAQLKASIDATPDFLKWKTQTLTGMLAAKDRLEAMDEEARIASRASTAAPVPMAAPVAPPTVAVAPAVAPEAGITKEISPGVRVNSNLSQKDIARVMALGDKGRMSYPGERWTLSPTGNLISEPILGATAANNLAPPVANVNAMNPNAATMQAINVERTRLEAERNRLLNLRQSKGVQDELKGVEAQLKEINAPVNLRAEGTAFIPGRGMLTAAPTMTDAQKYQAVLDDPNATPAQKATATNQLTKLNNIPEKAMSDFEKGLAASNLPETEKSRLRNAWLKSHSEHAPPMQVVMPVAIQDPKDPTKVIYVDRSQAIGQTPAAEVPKPLTAAQTQKLKTEKAADTAHVNASQSTADELDRLATQLVGSEDKKIKPHPGLAAITGYRALLPNLPESDARKAQQKLDTFKGKILALGREMASQNGKLGNMAVQEWKFVSDAVQALDPKAGNLDVQMRDVVRQAQAFAKNQKSKFESTYEDTGAVAPAAGSGIDTSNPLLR